jgi:uncharacterized protein YjbJ (UPF0337 family)
MTDNEPVTLKAPLRRGRRLLAAAAVVLMVSALLLAASASYVLYRTGRAIASLESATDRLSERIDRIGEKSERVAGSAAEVAGKIENLAGKVEALGDRMDLVEGWGEALKGEGGKLGAGEEELVRGLLNAVRDSGLKFVRGGEEKSAWRMYAWLYAKYQLWKPTLASTDEFISKVASESLGGTSYQVIGGDGAKVPLGDWLRERLAERRAATAAASGKGQ